LSATSARPRPVPGAPETKANAKRGRGAKPKAADLAWLSAVRKATKGTGTAAWLQARNDLLLRILDGDLRPGDALPKESLMATAYAVSKPTLRRALADLAHAGLIQTLHGVGNIVAERPVLDLNRSEIRARLGADIDLVRSAPGALPAALPQYQQASTLLARRAMGIPYGTEGPVEPAMTSPRCGRCGADLASSARYRKLEVPAGGHDAAPRLLSEPVSLNASGLSTEPGPLTVAIVFCRECGTVVVPADQLQ
jgi:DNA-binding transcriptional regulator YhcF (GntR family)